jgi:hypothetical protein
MTATPLYTAGCRHCAAARVAVGPRLTDETLRALGDHVRLVHPRVELSADAHAGAILAYFNVAETEAQ